MCVGDVCVCLWVGDVRVRVCACMCMCVCEDDAGADEEEESGGDDDGQLDVGGHRGTAAIATPVPCMFVGGSLGSWFNPAFKTTRDILSRL